MQQAARVGRGVAVTPKHFSHTELATVALVAVQQNRLGSPSGAFVFRHIAEQDALFKRIVGLNVSGASAGRQAVPSWHSSIQGKGFFVDIGAVRPLTGFAFVASQVGDMEKH